MKKDICSYCCKKKGKKRSEMNKQMIIERVTGLKLKKVTKLGAKHVSDPRFQKQSFGNSLLLVILNLFKSLFLKRAQHHPKF